ncbi:transposase [Rugamonas sp. CCM 8940]|uniref:transposase n=1 Tax=Rugamonas sp. CCM 8940 TaxID=2765359 RepID=UPI0018F34AB5|nr:transposase [Rugamonas sp. CCM 8940]MBJ7309983.1 transposase [Rugamonas sp. CCM 8940]
MTRPLRLEFPGALYHITSRGDRSEDIYCDSGDRYAWLEIVGRTAARFNLVVHAYCQMSNHYHLLLETSEGNLSQGMRQLNGLYSQHFNRRHGVVGHLFQGRYKAILVQKDNYLLELARYIVLNPLRANMVRTLGEWPWSNHHSTMGRAAVPTWLHTDWLLNQFAASRHEAIPAYEKFVMAGHSLPSPLSNTTHQVFLGDDSFIAQHRQPPQADLVRAVSKVQRRSLALPLDEYEKIYANRDEAMARAYYSTAFTMQQIGKQFGVSYKTVGRAVQKYQETLSSA